MSKGMTWCTGHGDFCPMNRNPLAVVNEFLRSSDAQLRSNAITALAVIDSDESIAMLVQVAQSDTSASVRQHAEDELIGLTGDSAARAIKVLYAALDDARQQMPTYTLLGRLRSRGFSVTMPTWGMLRRLRLVWAMCSYLYYPTSTWAFRLRTLVPALLGGILGAFLFGWFLAMTLALQPNSDAFLGILLWGVLVPPVFGVAVSQRSSSINLHVDRIAAFLVEVGIATFWGFLLALPF